MLSGEASHRAPNLQQHLKRFFKFYNTSKNNCFPFNERKCLTTAILGITLQIKITFQAFVLISLD